ncbi:MAG TPA: hypothetical protein PKD00_03320 [Burkholderiales bacterium]|nr:hypothetical protein [Burkholderiales bacterium]
MKVKDLIDLGVVVQTRFFKNKPVELSTVLDINIRSYVMLNHIYDPDYRFHLENGVTIQVLKGVKLIENIIIENDIPHVFFG